MLYFTAAVLELYYLVHTHTHVKLKLLLVHKHQRKDFHFWVKPKAATHVSRDSSYLESLHCRRLLTDIFHSADGCVRFCQCYYDLTQQILAFEIIKLSTETRVSTKLNIYLK